MLASDGVYSEALENFRVFGDNSIILNAKYKKCNDIFAKYTTSLMKENQILIIKEDILWKTISE